MLQLTLLEEYKAQFFHLGLNQNCSTCERVLLWRMGGFVSFVTIPIVQKLRKMPSFLIYLIQTEIFQQLKVWVHQSKSQLKALLAQRVRFENYRYWSLHQNLDSPRFPKCCYWKWFVSIIETVFLHKYRFDFLCEGHKATSLREKDLILISVSWSFASKSGHSEKSKVFFLKYVDFQYQSSL